MQIRMKQKKGYGKSFKEFVVIYKFRESYAVHLKYCIADTTCTTFLAGVTTILVFRLSDIMFLSTASPAREEAVRRAVVRDKINSRAAQPL